MQSNYSVHERLLDMERQLRALKAIVALGCAAFGVIGLTSFLSAEDGVVQAQRFEVVDADGTRIGAFGIGAISERFGVLPGKGRGIGWVLMEPTTKAQGSFMLMDEQAPATEQRGVAALHLEAGDSIASLHARDTAEKQLCALNFTMAKDEVTYVSLVTDKKFSGLRLVSDGSTESLPAVGIACEAAGPSVQGFDAAGKQTIDIK